MKLPDHRQRHQEDKDVFRSRDSPRGDSVDGYTQAVTALNRLVPEIADRKAREEVDQKTAYGPEDGEDNRSPRDSSERARREEPHVEEQDGRFEAELRGLVGEFDGEESLGRRRLSIRNIHQEGRLQEPRSQAGSESTCPGASSVCAGPGRLRALKVFEH